MGDVDWVGGIVLAQPAVIVKAVMIDARTIHEIVLRRFLPVMICTLFVESGFMVGNRGSARRG